jgi:hypothetical protein
MHTDFPEGIGTYLAAENGILLPPQRKKEALHFIASIIA